MLTKAIIKSQIAGSNKYLISIPSYQKSGEAEQTKVAAVCYQPGNIYGYRAGDIVYIDFEGLNMNAPVIVGKLFLGDEEEATSHQNVKNLDVSGRTKLSNNTTIGEFEWDTVAKLLRSLELRLQQIEEEGK